MRKMAGITNITKMKNVFQSKSMVSLKYCLSYKVLKTVSCIHLII